MRSANWQNNRVLIVDDQPEIHEDFKETLAAGAARSAADEIAREFLPSEQPHFLPAFDLSHAANGEQACELVAAGQAQGRPVALAYVDIRMPPGIDGVETVRRMRRLDRAIEVVMMTAYTDKPLADIVQDMDFLHKLLYIRKPFAREEIQQITLSLVEKWNVEQQVHEARRRLTDEHRRLEAVLDATGDAIAMYDGGGKLMFANRWYERLFDLSARELREMPRDAAAARFEQQSAVTDARRGDGACPPRDGSLVEYVRPKTGGLAGRRLFHCSHQPVRDAEERAIGELVVYRDVSREFEIERMKREVDRLRSLLEKTGSFDGSAGTGAGDAVAKPAEVVPLADLEERAIRHALDVSDNDLGRAARALGIDRTALRRKLKQYGDQAPAPD